jgi:hypothetical protein
MAHRIIKSAGIWSFTPNFSWVWWEDATSTLYHCGYDEFFLQNARLPQRWDFLDVLLYGYFLTGWDEVDPWFFACKGIGIKEELWLQHRPGTRVGVIKIRQLKGGD